MNPIIKREGKPTKSIQQKPKNIKVNKATTIKDDLEADLREMDEHEKLIKTSVRSKGYTATKINKYLEKQLGDKDPTIRYIKNLKYAGKDLISIRINRDVYEHKNYTIKNIKKITNDLSHYLEKKNVQGKIMTALLYGDLSWKSGYLRKMGEDCVLYDPNLLYNLEVPYEEPKFINSFNIYLALGNREDIGGDDDKFNDCLYNCLKYIVFNIEDYFKSPSEFKKMLGLQRSDKVPLSLIGFIETKLKTFQINIRGDVIRSSTIKSSKQINLILQNQHFTIEKIKNTLTPFIKYDEKVPILLNRKTMEAFNGERQWNMTKEERNSYYKQASPYILILTQKQGLDKEGNRIILSLEEEYKQFIVIADTLKKESKGLINLYKTGSYHDAALSLFDRITKYIKPEPILQDESLWIKESSFSALIWAEKYEGELFKYDVKSLYPYLMTSSTLKIPIKRGEFKIITEFNKYPEFGIYHCIIEKSEDKNINKLFRWNRNNKYSQPDIFNAQELGLKINLIMDDKPNFLYYPRENTVAFSELFKQYVEILFPLKENQITSSKNVLNILWGALCEIDKKKHFVSNEFKISDDEEILEIYPSSIEGHDIIRTTKINSFYKTPYARLCPFLLAQGRRHMAKLLYEHRDNVHRIQTDGFLVDKLLHENITVPIGGLNMRDSLKME